MNFNSVFRCRVQTVGSTHLGGPCALLGVVFARALSPSLLFFLFLGALPLTS